MQTQPSPASPATGGSHRSRSAPTCQACAHHKSVAFFSLTHNFCAHHAAAIDLVTGELATECAVMRAAGGPCGPDGELFCVATSAANQPVANQRTDLGQAN